jgi:hypothetical protein
MQRNIRWTSHKLNLSFSISLFRITHLFVVSDLPTDFARIIRYAYIHEAAIFHCSKLMKIVPRWSHHKHLILVNEGIGVYSCINDLLRVNALPVLVQTQIVIYICFVQFVQTFVPEHSLLQNEKHKHIWMIMQRHHLAFLQTKEIHFVVFILVNNDSTYFPIVEMIAS